MPSGNKLQAYRGQFSETVFPEPKTRPWKTPGKLKPHLQHRISCCDCGLSHDFEFLVVRTRVNKNGRTIMVAVAPRNLAIQFRVRRNERATAQIRRKKQVCNK